MSSRSQRFISSDRRRSVVERQSQGLTSQLNNRSAFNAGIDEEQDDDEDEDDQDDDEDATSSEDINQTVKKLVRYVLACDYQRSTIKRSGITEKIIGKQQGGFKRVFEETQQQLRSRFGLELVELPARQKVTLREKKAAQKSKGSYKSSTSYILKTTLPHEYRNPEIMPLFKDWSTSDEYAYIGLYTVIICLISLSADGQLANHQLDRYLKRLNLDRNTGLGTTSELLARMKKENYLQETKTMEKDGETSEWRVGPRGIVEVDKEAIKKFVQKMYGENAPADLLHKLQRSLGTETNPPKIPTHSRPSKGSGYGLGKEKTAVKKDAVAFPRNTMVTDLSLRNAHGTFVLPEIPETAEKTWAIVALKGKKKARITLGNKETVAP
ncbi:hypothetical protein EPUL_004114, partial [Erysiphe pulchra]